MPDDATIELNDCDCKQEVMAAKASGVSVEGLPNEDGAANCADVDSVKLAKCSRLAVENKVASGGCRPGDANSVRSGGKEERTSATRAAEGGNTLSPSWTNSIDKQIPNTRSS